MGIDADEDAPLAVSASLSVPFAPLYARVGAKMEDRIEEDEYEELGDEQKIAIGKWFLLNAPPGQVLQVAKGNKQSHRYFLGSGIEFCSGNSEFCIAAL